VLALVFVLIIVRRIGKYRFQIWQIMALGAIAVFGDAANHALDALKSHQSGRNLLPLRYVYCRRSAGQ